MAQGGWGVAQQAGGSAKQQGGALSTLRKKKGGETTVHILVCGAHTLTNRWRGGGTLMGKRPCSFHFGETLEEEEAGWGRQG